MALKDWEIFSINKHETIWKHKKRNKYFNPLLSRC